MKQKFKNVWKDVIAFCVLFSCQLSLLSQCPTANVVSKDYFSHQCGSSHFQSLIGVQIPVYKKVGNLHLTSPLTDYIIPSGTLDVEVSKLKVYPNPAMDVVQVHWENSDFGTFEIISTLGQVISSFQAEPFQITTLDIAHLPTGYYTIKAKSKSNHYFITKLIKQ